MCSTCFVSPGNPNIEIGVRQPQTKESDQKLEETRMDLLLQAPSDSTALLTP